MGLPERTAICAPGGSIGGAGPNLASPTELTTDGVPCARAVAEHTTSSRRPTLQLEGFLICSPWPYGLLGRTLLKALERNKLRPQLPSLAAGRQSGARERCQLIGERAREPPRRPHR